MMQAICYMLALFGGRSIPSFASAQEPPETIIPQQQLTSPHHGMRRPPGSFRFHYPSNNKDECHPLLCVGPSQDHYPIGHEPGVIFTSRFRVPPLPKIYDSDTMTYYDYYNIFWRQQPQGGFMNQFVPQLMLGNVLANSSNFPHYEPQWLVLDTWHIGAQYFFALPCNENNNNNNNSTTTTSSQKKDPCWIAKAATGKLIPVQPGQVIETTFTLLQEEEEEEEEEGVANDNNINDWQWHLRMGVVGGHPSQWSLVVAKTPFMGLVSNTTWQDDIYLNVTVGSCLENYNLHISDNYPETWEIAMDILVPDRAPQWDDWIQHDNQYCDWVPQSTLASVEGSTWQRATWNATLRKQQEIAPQ
jgi:hypothetical protein